MSREQLLHVDNHSGVERSRVQAGTPAVYDIKSKPSSAEFTDEEAVARLAQFLVDKDYSFAAARKLHEYGVYAHLMSSLVMRNSFGLREEVGRRMDALVSAYPRGIRGSHTKRYHGSAKENRDIRGAIKTSGNRNMERGDQGNGIAFSYNGINHGLRHVNRRDISSVIGDTPVVIMGGGPAGLFTALSLIDVGFDRRKITVIDKNGAYGGIWNMKNVSSGERNNPRELIFLRHALSAAPGSGHSISHFLKNVERGYSPPDPVKGKVIEVQATDFSTKVHVRDQGRRHVYSAPIVINAVGNGLPLYPNRPTHMTTDTPERAGVRWQQKWDIAMAERYNNKSLRYIGLGNSTAEEIKNILYWNSRGYNIDYKIITHFSEEALQNPFERHAVVDAHGNISYQQVFRNPSNSNLTGYEGDINIYQNLYFTALREGRIISEISHWNLRGNVLELYQKRGQDPSIITGCDQLFTLIGYGHSSESFEKMGITAYLDKDHFVSPEYDYDGEFQRPLELHESEGRMIKGYYGIGAVLKRSDYKSAETIPGILYQLPDLMFSAVMRAAEYQSKKSLLKNFTSIGGKVKEMLR